MPGTNEYQVFLADVLCGFVKNYGEEKAMDLTRPPPRTADFLYDSVQGGPHRGWFRADDTKTIMYVVYDNAQAYPSYLITFTINEL